MGHQYGRTVIEERAVWYDDYLPRILPTIGDAETLEVIRTARTSDKTLRRMRKRLGEKYIPTFIGFIGQVLMGQFDGWTTYLDDGSDDDKMALEKLLRLGRARNIETISRDQHLYDDFEGAFQLISARIGELKLMDIYKSLSDQQVVQARNEIRLFLLIAQLTYQQSKFSVYEFGLKTLADFSKQIPFRIAELMLLFLATLKEDRVFQERIDSAIEIFRKAAQLGVTNEKIQCLKANDPALTEIVFG